MKTQYALLSVFVFVWFFAGTTLAQQTIIVDLAGTGDYTSIHDAVDNASDGDTIRVQPDQYAFTADLGQVTVDKELIIIGAGYMPVEEGGTELIDIAKNGFFALTGSADGTIIRGFRVQGASNFLTSESGASGITIEQNLFISGDNTIRFEGNQDTVRHNIFIDGGVGQVRAIGTNTQVTNNIFSELSRSSVNRGFVEINDGTGVIVAYNLFLNCDMSHSSSGTIESAGSPEVYSNGFIDNSRPYNTDSGTPFVTNNGFYNSSSHGLNPVEEAPSFQNFDPDNDVLNTENIDDNDFDFTLADGSGWIDMGRTGTPYLDEDGSRSDIGVYAGPNPFVGGKGAPSVPVVIEMQVSPTTVSPTGTITIQATGRIGDGSN